MNSLQLAKKRVKKESGKGKKSKLDPHIEAIRYLKYEENYTIEQIQNFLLEDCNCKVAASTLHQFIKRRFQKSSESLEDKNNQKLNPKKIAKKEIVKQDQQIKKDTKVIKRAETPADINRILTQTIQQDEEEVIL